MGRGVILRLKDDCGKAIFEACDLQDNGMFKKGGTYNSKRNSKQERREEVIK